MNKIMKFSFVFAPLLAAAPCSNIMASADDDEHMEVTAPDLSGALPGGLAALAGWVGASGSGGAGSGTLKAAALKAAAKAAAEHKQQKDQEKEAQEKEESDFQKFQENNPGAMSVLFHEIGLTLRQILSNGVDYKVTTKDKDGNETTIKDCQPSGPLNPKGHTCTQQKFERFTDPTDGVERWAFTYSAVEAAYNPKHIDADASGYYPKVVGKQTFTLVFETEPDLIDQLTKVAAAR